MQGKAAVPITHRSGYAEGRRGNLMQRAFGAVAFAVHVIDRSIFVVGQFPSGERSAILGTYVRLKWHHFLKKLIPSLDFPSERLLGHRFDVADHLSLVGMFESIFLEMEYQFRAQTDQPRIIDCGSNIGLSLLSFKRQYPKSRILAFEPDPTAFQLLKNNVAQNGWSDIVLHNCAVLDRDGVVTLYGDPTQRASVLTSTVAGTGFPATHTVEAVRLSRFIEGKVDLLKLDIEGAEQRVLQELAISGKLASLQQIILEYHHHVRSDNDDSMSSILQLLETNGFGYELSAYPTRPFQRGRFSCIMIYAYKKPSS